MKHYQNLKNGPKFNDIYQCHSPQKNSTKNPPTTLVLNIYVIFKLYDRYYFITYIFHMFKIFKVCDLEKMINLNLKLIKYI
jgi:hypothetical protein